jgi:hypothetical protein
MGCHSRGCPNTITLAINASVSNAEATSPTVSEVTSARHPIAAGLSNAGRYV